MPLYFAYGSNMDVAAMAERCPSSKAVGVGRLIGHRFLIFEGGYASVARDPRHVVWGMVWNLALGDVPALDRYESLSTGLYTKTFLPVLTAQGPRRAMIYLGRSDEPGTPEPGYMESVVDAATQAGLPEEYVQGLRQWLPKARESASPMPARTPVQPRWGAPEGSSVPVRRK